VVDIENESGRIERYASNKFNKTIRQIRQDESMKYVRCVYDGFNGESLRIN
jgi:hypothetical protein